ncbi:MAG: redoxin family protein [Candidatus Bathyarchaeia archaeon]
MAKLNLGGLAPGFKGLLGVDGRRYSLEDFRDKKALAVVISCNHCPTVKAYEDRMKEIQREFGDKGFLLVAVNPNDAEQYPEDGYKSMVKRAKEEGLQLPLSPR